MPLFSSTQPLTLPELAAALASRDALRLPAEAEARVQAGHDCLHRHLAPAAGAASAEPAGWLLAHAGGTGPEVPAELVRRLLLLKAQSLSYGHGGVQVATVRRLLDFFNRDVWPVVYAQGAAGPGGDVGALAHLCLPLLGLGEVNYQGYRLAASDVLGLFGWEPLHLHAHEAAALLSGTHFTLAYATEALERTERLLAAADVVGALSAAGLGVATQPFAAALHRARPQAGPALVAQRLRELLAGVELPGTAPAGPPAPYSFSCLPQVHGASRDAVAYVAQVVAAACNAATEDPAVFPAEDLVLHGGNFHGQPLALALDHLALAAAELGNISARRTGQLLAGQPGLPGAQATAASLASQNRQLGTPASTDHPVGSPTADYVSLAANAATKARQVVENVEQLLGIELLAVGQALAARPPLGGSPALAAVVAAFGEAVTFVEAGQVLAPTLPRAARFVREYPWT